MSVSVREEAMKQTGFILQWNHVENDVFIFKFLVAVTGSESIGNIYEGSLANFVRFVAKLEIYIV
jgi:hypothetical protein